VRRSRPHQYWLCSAFSPTLDSQVEAATAAADEDDIEVGKEESGGKGGETGEASVFAVCWSTQAARAKTSQVQLLAVTRNRAHG
jgi:hypothetical protein